MSITESEFQKTYEIQSPEYRANWEEIHRSVFRLPPDPMGTECENWTFASDEPANEEGWRFFPERVFQPSFNLAFFDENILNWGEGFEKLRQFITAVGDSEFGFARLPAPPHRATSMRFFRFPAEVTWEDFSSGGEKSPSAWATTFNFHLIGHTGNWGIYYAEACCIYLLGYANEEVLTAAQSALDFQGRNLELVESIDFNGWGGLIEKQERRLKELAEQIRRE